MPTNNFAAQAHLLQTAARPLLDVVPKHVVVAGHAQGLFGVLHDEPVRSTRAAHVTRLPFESHGLDRVVLAGAGNRDLQADNQRSYGQW